MTYLTITNKFIKVLFTFIVIASLVSCGGNGESGGSSIPSNPIKITSANIDSIIDGTNDAEQDARTPTEMQTEPGSSTSQQPNTTTLNEKQQALTSVMAFTKQPRGNGIIALATNPCPAGGSYTIPDDSNGIGEYIYDDCKYTDDNDMLNYSVNGRILVSGSGSIDDQIFERSYEYQELAISVNDVNYVYNGTFHAAWNKTNALTTIDYEIPELTLFWGDNGIQISNYIVNYKNDTNANEESWFYQYTVSSTLLNGSVHVETPVTLRRTIGKPYLYQGQYEWTGENSSARLTVDQGGAGDPTDTVTIEVDEDGDGTYEFQKNVMWQDLG